MFRNAAFTGLLALGVAMLAGCGEPPIPAKAAAAPGSLAAVNEKFAGNDTNGDDKVSRAEYLARVEKRFKKFDKNKDGVIVAAELPQAIDPKAFFARDKNGDKKVTLAEQTAPMEARFSRLDANRDGLISVEEAPRPKPQSAAD